MLSIWSYPLHTLSPSYYLTNPHSFTHSLYTGNGHLGLQPQPLFWAPKYHLPRRPAAGGALHSDVPTVPHVVLPRTAPPPRFPSPTERTGAHAPGTLSGNPDLGPPLFSATSNRHRAHATHASSLSPSPLLTLPFWPPPPLPQDTALSSTTFSREHNESASPLCLRAFSCLPLTPETVQTPHPAVWGHKDWASGRRFSITLHRALILTGPSQFSTPPAALFQFLQSAHPSDLSAFTSSLLSLLFQPPSTCPSALNFLPSCPFLSK